MNWLLKDDRNSLGEASDDVGVKVVGQGKAVEVFHVMELFDNLQAGLKGFNFGS